MDTLNELETAHQIYLIEKEFILKKLRFIQNTTTDGVYKLILQEVIEFIEKGEI